MRTISLKIHEEYYSHFMFLLQNMDQKILSIVDDSKNNNFPAITKDEATRRVTKAVDGYKDGSIKTVAYQDGMDEIDRWLASLQSK